MKKLLLILVLALNINLSANPGDTTWVQANNVYLDYYNNFDTLVHFPNGTTTYRKILMLFTLGEYNCPAGAQYCHQWDYTVSNYILTSTDTLELSRFITPYANSGVPRFPSTWQQHYWFDVTDFAPLLKDSAKIRVLYSGYSGGFTGNIKFAFIEGTPAREVIGIQRLWLGSYTFGNPADPIMNHIPVKSLTAPANTSSAELKYTVTGHGSDNTTQCCEFASHTYSVSLNGSVVSQKDIWRDDCGFNQLYPQGGTWIYNRANWCPGDAVHTDTHVLPGVVANSTYSLGINYDSYTSTGNYGSYTMEGHVVYYKNFNYSVDASLEDIIAPTNFEDHFRENPAGDKPVVKVHNAGSATINSITFSYGVKDSVATQYTWNGTLLGQQDTIITLGTLNTLTNMSLSGATGNYGFVAKIISVDGAADEDTTNNTMHSTFVAAPTWPTTIVVVMATNNEGVTNLNVNPSETSWQITDANNNVVAQRINANLAHVYRDTITLPANAFYKLTISDLGCDGLHWWVWTSNPSYGVTSGSFAVKAPGGSNFPMNGFTYGGTYGYDFGCGFSQNFTTGAALSDIQTISKKSTSFMEVYPNPANDNITIMIGGPSKVNGSIELIDGQGRVVLKQKAIGEDNLLNLNGVVAGIYTVIYKDNSSQIQKRIAIVK